MKTVLNLCQADRGCCFSHGYSQIICSQHSVMPPRPVTLVIRERGSVLVRAQLGGSGRGAGPLMPGHRLAAGLEQALLEASVSLFGWP